MTHTILVIPTGHGVGLTATTTFDIVVIDTGIVPVNSTAPLLRMVTTDPDYVLLSFESVRATAGAPGVLQVSSDLRTWTLADPLLAASIVAAVDATTDTVTYYLPRAALTGPNRFFRIRIAP